jgi:hypothetical protein
MMASKPTGRPTKYNDELVDEICTRVANGTPLREICREEGKPAWTTFYNWINADKDLFERFVRARELGTDAIAEDTLAIIDEKPEYVEDERSSRVDSGYVQWQKNRVELRLKLLSKWNPRKYGDRQILAGDKDAPVEIKHSNILDETILNFERKLQLQNESEES